MWNNYEAVTTTTKAEEIKADNIFPSIDKWTESCLFLNYFAMDKFISKFYNKMGWKNIYKLMNHPNYKMEWNNSKILVLYKKYRIVSVLSKSLKQH